MAASRSIQFVLLIALALFGRTVVCQDDDEPAGYGGDGDGDEGYGGGDGGEEGYGGGGEEGEEAPPPSGDVTELTSVAELDAFIDNEDASVVLALTVKEMADPGATLPEGWDAEEDGEWSAPKIENPMLTTYKALTSSVYGYRYAQTSEPEVLAKLKAKASGLYLFRSPKFLSAEDGDRPRERFPSDKMSESAVSNWLKSKSQPLVGLYSSSTSSRYTDAVLVIFMNLDWETNAKSVTYVLKRARKVAASLKGKKLSVAVAKLADMTYELGDYGLESTKPKSDILFGIKANKPGGEVKYYGGSEAFSANALTSFAQKFVDGQLTAHVRPPPPPYEPPADGDDGPGEDDSDDSEGEDEADETEPKEEM